MLATRFRYGATSFAHDIKDEATLRHLVPSIFAEHAHESRSTRYTYIPTIEVVRGLAREGFVPTFACEARSRDVTRYGFTKHMIRFRREGDAKSGEVPEVILINSHDGSTSYQLLAGLFRFVCQNGLVVGDRFGEVRVRHTGDVVGEVIDAAYEVVDTFGKALDSANAMKEIGLTRPEQEAFAEAAALLRFAGDDDDQNKTLPIKPPALLMPRRSEDVANDLWTTYNRVQENVIRGGLRGLMRNANGCLRRVTTREVKGIDQNVKLNRALWTLAERMAAIKQAG